MWNISCFGIVVEAVQPQAMQVLNCLDDTALVKIVPTTIIVHIPPLERT